MIVICPECARDMIEVREDLYRCPGCNLEAEQLAWKDDEPEE